MVNWTIVLAVLVFGTFASVILFILAREFVLWYWKVAEIVATLKKIEAKLPPAPQATQSATPSRCKHLATSTLPSPGHEECPLCEQWGIDE